MYMPELSRALGNPLGMYGLALNGQEVQAATGAAARAGLKAGDRVDLADNPKQIVFVLTSSRIAVAPHPGMPLNVTVLRNPPRHITLQATPEPSIDYPYLVVRQAVFAITVLTATLLVLIKRNLRTWSFFLFALNCIDAADSRMVYALPDWSRFAVVLFEGNGTIGLMKGGILGVAGSLGLLVLVLSFDQRSSGRARRTLFALTAPVMLAAVAMVTFDRIVLAYSGQVPSDTFALAESIVGEIASALIAILALLAFIHARGDARQRFKWVLLGLFVWAFSVYWPFPTGSYIWYSVTTIAQGVLPASVAYALLRERVVDINFFISRAVAYGAMTSIIVAVFALLDLYFSNAMTSAHVGALVDVTVALLFAFSLNALHHRVESLVDRLLFRRRHIAETQLRKAAASVLLASSSAAIGDMVVNVPAEVLELTCAALFVRDGQTFRLRNSHGWHHDFPHTFDANDRLPLYVGAETKPTPLSEVPGAQEALRAATAPVLAVPIFRQAVLAGISLYGAHRNNADLDADERDALYFLAERAGVAYDLVELNELRARLAMSQSGSGVLS